MFPSFDFATNKKFFKTSSTGLLFVGFALALLGLLAFTSGGWFFSAIGAVIIVVHYLGRPPGPESIDNSVEQIVAYAREASGRKLSIPAGEQEIRPIEVFGFSNQTFEGAAQVESRIAESLLRTSVVRVMIAYFAHDQVHIYTLASSLTQPETFAETTVEFFYQDVVSLSTENGPQGTSLILSTSDGSKYACPVKNAATLDAEVNVARDLIRSKRVG